jgi:hypothetical protein
VLIRSNSALPSACEAARALLLAIMKLQVINVRESLLSCPLLISWPCLGIATNCSAEKETNAVLSVVLVPGRFSGRYCRRCGAEQADSDRKRARRCSERRVWLADNQSPNENDHERGHAARRCNRMEFFTSRLL